MLYSLTEIVVDSEISNLQNLSFGHITNNYKQAMQIFNHGPYHCNDHAIVSPAQQAATNTNDYRNSPLADNLLTY